MHKELIEIISDYYKEDYEETMNMLDYIYSITENKKLKYEIEDWFFDKFYCKDCHSKLEVYCYEEHHSELFGNPTEMIYEYYCPHCDSEEIKRNNLKKC